MNVLFWVYLNFWSSSPLFRLKSAMQNCASDVFSLARNRSLPRRFWSMFRALDVYFVFCKENHVIRIILFRASTWITSMFCGNFSPIGSLACYSFLVPLQVHSFYMSCERWFFLLFSPSGQFSSQCHVILRECGRQKKIHSQPSSAGSAKSHSSLAHNSHFCLWQLDCWTFRENVSAHIYRFQFPARLTMLLKLEIKN